MVADDELGEACGVKVCAEQKELNKSTSNTWITSFRFPFRFGDTQVEIPHHPVLQLYVNISIGEIPKVGCNDTWLALCVHPRVVLHLEECLRLASRNGTH